jgi:myo-inositol-1(or 4)-monophosphatase
VADDALAVARVAALAGGAVAMAGFRGPHEVSEKGRRADIVTEVDRASEAAIVTCLRASYPDATIVAEEAGLMSGRDDERWLVDPIDGTTNYAHGYPIFCISIAYERHGELQAAAIYAPAMNELFLATRGGGATLNGAPIAVSHVDSLGSALICTGFHPADFDRNGSSFRAVSNRAQGVRRDGSAALDLAYVAAGRFDGFWEYDLHAWDVAAGTLLVREAGGRVDRIDGGAASLDAGSILASNGRIHDELHAVLQSPLTI